MIRAALGASCVAASLFFGSICRADAAGLVTVIRTSHDAAWIDEATARIAGELRAAGFRVEVVDRRASSEGPAGGVATIAVVATAEGAEADVWLNDRVTDKLRVKRVIEADPSSPNAASDSAVRSVELLRASLLEATPRQKAALAPPIAAWLERRAEPLPAPAPAPVPGPARAAPSVARPPPASAATPPPAARELSLEASPGFVTGPGAGLAAVPLVVRVGAALPHRFGVRLTGGAALVTTASRPHAISAVAVRQSFVAIDATYTLPFPTPLLVPTLSLGGGTYLVEADGSGAPPFYGLHPRSVSAFVDAGAALELRLRPDLGLVAGASALVLDAEPAITIEGDPVFRTGRPAVLGTLGLVAHF